MPRLIAMMAPLALALLWSASVGLVGVGAANAGDTAVTKRAAKPVRVAAPLIDMWSMRSPLAVFLERQTVRQVRIERRVVVRISPQTMAARQELSAQMFERELAGRYAEKRIGTCLPLEGIAAVQTGSGNRLVLFLRDQRMVSLSLEKTCRARDFYSGFYVERHEDGRLCVDRDRLQSRTGVQCGVARLRQLVVAED
jgi:hypothetical protein